MRILFMGSPSFAVPSLKILLDHNYEIPAVVSAPDKPRGRGQQVSFTPIKEVALQHQLLVLQPENLKDTTFIAKIRQLYIDLIVVVAFRILPREVSQFRNSGHLILMHHCYHSIVVQHLLIGQSSMVSKRRV